MIRLLSYALPLALLFASPAAATILTDTGTAKPPCNCGAAAASALVPVPEDGPANTALVTAALAPPPGLAPGSVYHRVFVTSFDTDVVTFNDFPPSLGEFGDVRGADWNVSRAAYTAGLLPGWNGTDLRYKAILSDLTTNARDHISVQGPVYNMANELIALDAADLWDGTLEHAIAYNELGGIVAQGTRVWTGSGATGTTAPSKCGNWNNPNEATITGDPHSTNPDWTIKDPTDCDTLARLYGFSEPLVVPNAEAVPEPSTLALAALALLSLGLWAWRTRRA